MDWETHCANAPRPLRQGRDGHGLQSRRSGLKRVCETQYISPPGLIYPEWLGAIFYVVLVFIVGWRLLTPFGRLDRASPPQGQDS